MEVDLHRINTFYTCQFLKCSYCVFSSKNYKTEANETMMYIRIIYRKTSLSCQCFYLIKKGHQKKKNYQLLSFHLKRKR